MPPRKPGRPPKPSREPVSIKDRESAIQAATAELNAATSDVARLGFVRVLIDLTGAGELQLPKHVPKVPADPLKRATFRLGEVRRHLKVSRGRVWLDYLEEERRLLDEMKGTTPEEGPFDVTTLTDDELDAAIEEARRRHHPGVIPA
jgi:hypothetical protein